MFSLSISFILSIFTIILFYSLFSKSRSKDSKLPPGSTGWIPYFGQLFSFLASHPVNSRGKFLDNSITRYGKIFRSYMFGRPTIISCDVEFNYLILMNEGRLVTAAYQAPLHKILGEKSLLALTGDAHKRMYGIALTILNTLKSPEGSFLSDIERTVLDTMESWKGKDTLVFVDQTRKVTYNVMVKQLLGLDATDAVAIEMFRDFETFVTGFFSVPINLPGMAFAKAVQTCQTS